MSLNIKAIFPMRIYTKFARKKKDKIKANISDMENGVDLDKDNNMEKLAYDSVHKKKKKAS